MICRLMPACTTSRYGPRWSRRRARCSTTRTVPSTSRQGSLTAAEASPDIAVQIYNRAIHNQMMARLKEGQTIPQVIAWAQDELEGFAR